MGLDRERRPRRLRSTRARRGQQHRHPDPHRCSRLCSIYSKRIDGGLQTLLPRSRRHDVGHLRPARCIQSRSALDFPNLHGPQSSSDRCHDRKLPDRFGLEALPVESRGSANAKSYRWGNGEAALEQSNLFDANLSSLTPDSGLLLAIWIFGWCSESRAAFCPDALSFRKLTTGILFLSQFPVGIGKESVGVDRVGTQLDCFAQVRQSLCAALLLNEDPAEKKIRRKIVRVRTQRTLEFFRCFRSARRSLIHESQVEVHHGRTGHLGNGGFEVRRCFLPSSGFHQSASQFVAGEGIVRFLLDQIRQWRYRLLVLP